MELFTRIKPSKLSLSSPGVIVLIDRKTGVKYEYPLYLQSNIKSFKNSSLIRELDQKKLEVEYDYDTDCEQQRCSKQMLMKELSEAIDFYVKEDPIKLVGNVML